MVAWDAREATVGRLRVDAGVPEEAYGVDVAHGEPSLIEAPLNRLAGKRAVVLDSREAFLHGGAHDDAVGERRGSERSWP